MTTPTISVVIPVYNAALNLPDLIAALAETLPALSRAHEIILVNDGSRDASWAVIESLAGQYPVVRGIDLMRNFGQHSALLCGIRAAQYDVIVTMDDDLQHPPGEIHKLLDKLAEGYDVVYGTPQHEQHHVTRSLASQWVKLAMRMAMGVSIASSVSAFRAMRTQVRDAFSHYDSPYVIIDVLLTWGTTRFAAVPVRHAPRARGKSNYNYRRLLAHTLNMVTGFSTLPLRLASYLGFGFTLFGIMILVYVVGRYMALGHSIPGFPFLASTIAIFSGVQLFALGIIGEYLAQVHQRSLGRPSSVIRSQVGFGALPEDGPHA
jgi:glycosyltransferase involved in cell wall biosynthesis